MKTTILLLASLLFLNFSKKDKEIENLFSQTKKIEIYAYSNFFEWENEDNEKYIIVNNFKIPEKHLKNKIILNEKHILKLKKSLISSNKQIETRAKCYIPRHTIIFYEENNKILGHIELCFQCNGTRVSNNLKFLEDRMLFQKKFI